MLEVRQRLGDFEVIRLLGKGGMGEVYEALQLNPPRPVALKVLKGWLAEDDEALQRFWREAAVPARLDHPGIVRIIATGKTDDGIAYYAMQLVRGLTLSQLMHKAAEAARARTVPQNYPSEPPTPANDPTGTNLFLPAAATPADAGEKPAPQVLQQYQADRFGVVVRVGIQAARALASAHRQGVLHRDIKPSNLMIDHHDQLYVVDFGLTRALLGDGLSTRPGVVCGTPLFMSPEQARGEAVDGRSDLFSLGVTLYELASGGISPYAAHRRDSETLIRAVRKGRIDPLRSVAPGVPVELERIIHRLLRANPRRRYQTAEELIADLEKLNRQPEMRSGTRRIRLPARLVVYGGLGLVAVVGLAMMLLLWRGPHKPPPVSSTDWPPLPPERIERKPNYPLSLLTIGYNPIWTVRVVGEGRYDVSPRLKMQLKSMPKKSRTMYALDNDPERRWFDFSIRMQVMPTPVTPPAQVAALVSLLGPPSTRLTFVPIPFSPMLKPVVNPKHEAGIFFGYRHDPDDPDQGSSFFYVQLKEIRPGTGVPSQLLIGTAYLAEERGLRGTFMQWAPFPGEKGCMVLPARSANGWRVLRIRALDGKITLYADGEQLRTLDLRSKEYAAFVPERADPRGALGIWVNEGVGFFESGTITVLKRLDR